MLFTCVVLCIMYTSQFSPQAGHVFCSNREAKVCHAEGEALF